MTKEFIFLGLPEGAKNPHINSWSDCLWFYDRRDCITTMPLPAERWEFICLLSKATEEQAVKVVEQCPYYAKCWKHYTAINEHPNFTISIFDSKISCWTARESLITRAAADGFYLVNPLGDEPERYLGDTMKAYKSKLKAWQAAQSKTFAEIAVLKLIK